MGQDCPLQKQDVGNSDSRHQGGGEEKRVEQDDEINSKKPHCESSSPEISCMDNTRRADMAYRICRELRRVPHTKESQDIWVRQSFEKCRREAFKLENETRNNEDLLDLELQGDKDLSISEGLLETDRDESVIGLLKTTKKEFEFSLFGLKVFDFLFNVNMIALGALCFTISYKFEKSRISLPLNSTKMETAWLDNNITVLGKSKWTMSFNHFTLIFSIFHIVYGIIAIVCDLIFFQSLFKKMIKTRYISTVLPVHRLFFVVISSFDGIMFASSSNITMLVGDVFAVILVILINFIVLADTFVLLLSFKAVNGKSAFVFSKPWRNLVILVVIILTTLYSVVSQHPLYTWDIGPSLVWGLLSAGFLLKCLYNTGCGKTSDRSNPQDNVLNFLMCVSGSNVLGLCSVGAVAHSLIFDYYRTIFDHL